MSTNNYSEWYPLFAEKLGDRALFGVKLAPYLAYRVGGPADILVFPKTEDELAWIGEISTANQIPLTIIGTGTNLLVRDEGISGITVSLAQAFQEIETLTLPLTLDDTNGIWVRCGGGVSKPQLLEWATQRGYTGLEFSAGVPGTIGGGIFMNAGTKYGCYGDILRELRLYTPTNGLNGGFKQLSKDELHFGYRESTIKEQLVVWATFELKPGNKESIQTEVTRIIQERTEKQPLDFPSCGSTFKNGADYSSGRLIEKAGLKGLSVGGAQISTKHANFILNKGTATATDILTLIDIIKARVKEQFGISLECEVCVLGGNHKSQVQKKT